MPGRPASVAIPEHIARQRQMQQMAAGAIQNLRVQLTSEIFSRLSAWRFKTQITGIVNKAQHEANPFGVPLADEDLPPIEVRGDVDVNMEAKFAVHAANTLLHHLGLLKVEQEVAAETPVGENRTDGGIILNGGK
jgi:hypothetical protein